MVIPHLGDWKKTFITFVFGPFVRKIIGKQKIIGKSFCCAYLDMTVPHGNSNISFIIECTTPNRIFNYVVQVFAGLCQTSRILEY